MSLSYGFIIEEENRPVSMTSILCLREEKKMRLPTFQPPPRSHAAVSSVTLCAFLLFSPTPPMSNNRMRHEIPLAENAEDGLTGYPERMTRVQKLRADMDAQLQAALDAAVLERNDVPEWKPE